MSGSIKKNYSYVDLIEVIMVVFVVRVIRGVLPKKNNYFGGLGGQICLVGLVDWGGRGGQGGWGCQDGRGG